MKRKIILMVALAGLVSCKKYETIPLSNITSSNVWDPLDKNGDFAKQVLTDLYSYLPDGYNRIGGDLLDDASGDAIPSRNTSTVEYFTNGRLTSANNPDDCWSNSYKAIREANYFLANVDIVPIDATVKQYYKAEARFIRAMAYWEMVKRYGGVPLIGDKVLTLDDNLQIARNNYADCAAYIVSECEAIKNLLRPVSFATADDVNYGRINKGAALALKARVLLYGASPLFNGGGTSVDAVKKALTGYPTYDANRWVTALAAYQELIDLNAYTLSTSFNTAFTVRKSTEVILAKERAKTFDVETNNAPIGYSPAIGNGYTSPTQELVDAFPMLNGLAITDAASGYSAAAPYSGRDPRLTATVFYNNGPNWLTRPVQTFTGGLDRPGGTAVQTRTGYYMRKFMADFSAATAYSTQDHNFIIFRYGEVLLSYAECLNEVGRTADAYTQVIAIRKRAGITAGANNLYGLKAGMTQTEMRTAIQSEKRIECAFEEQRFWDIRRWKIADQFLNGTLHGVTITKTGTTTYTYAPLNVSTVQFQTKNYTIPVPYAEIITDRSLIQNEGW
jgi:hypothetical protein